MTPIILFLIELRVLIPVAYKHLEHVQSASAGCQFPGVYYKPVGVQVWTRESREHLPDSDSAGKLPDCRQRHTSGTGSCRGASLDCRVPEGAAASCRTASSAAGAPMDRRLD